MRRENIHRTGQLTNVEVGEIDLTKQYTHDITDFDNQRARPQVKVKKKW